MFGLRVPKPYEVRAGGRRRTYLALLLPVTATLILFLIFGSLARDLAPIFVDHFRFWRREIGRLVKGATVLWRG